MGLKSMLWVCGTILPKKMKKEDMQICFFFLSSLFSSRPSLYWASSRSIFTSFNKQRRSRVSFVRACRLFFFFFFFFSSRTTAEQQQHGEKEQQQQQQQQQQRLVEAFWCPEPRRSHSGRAPRAFKPRFERRRDHRIPMVQKRVSGTRGKGPTTTTKRGSRSSRGIERGRARDSRCYCADLFGKKS